MNFSYENQGVNTYLVYTIDDKDEIDSMSLGMLTNNKISGLAPAIFQQMDTTKYIKFNISSKVSVKQFFTGAVNKKKLVGVFTGIINAMLSAEEYMLDANTILLNLDYIYADVSTCDTVLVCLPIMLKNEPVDLGVFFKNLVFSTQFDQTENCDYVAKLINYLNSMPVFSLLDFKTILDELSQESQRIYHGTGMVQKTSVMSHIAGADKEILGAFKEQKELAPLQYGGEPESGFEEKDMVQQERVRATVGKSEKSLQGKSSSFQQRVENSEKEISWFYLMQHYNKENATLYKKQKEQKKQKAKAVQPTVSKEKTKKEKKNKKEGQVSQVPDMSQSFAIPGQSIPAIQPQNASIPQSTLLPESELVQQTLQNASSQSSNIVQNTPSTSQPRIITRTANFGETTVLSSDGIGETTVLNVAQQTEFRPKPYLIRTKNNEKIPLDKPVFRIGKEKSYVDYFIGDNTAISRSHANIITKDGEYFVVDTNSTNHTYVNGAMIQSNAETKISGGSRICLANEEFEFKLL